MSDDLHEPNEPNQPADVDQDPGVEYVPEDDAIIGVAFKWSVLVIVLLGSLGLVFFLLYRGGGEESETIIEKTVESPEALVPDVAILPDVTFTDITLESGIEFVHESAAEGEKLLPETMGSGVAFFDSDRDGDQDLLLINAIPWEGSDRVQAPMALLINDGTGHFTDVTAGSGLEEPMYGTGVAIGDVDADGLLDLYVTALGSNRLYRNLGENRFKDLTDSSGVASGPTDWSSSPAMFDYDGDGDLDLFVPNYVKWTRDLDISNNYTLNGTDRAYGPPKLYAGTQPELYRNDGTGRFEDVSEEAGIQVFNPYDGYPVAKSLAVVPIDLDRDGWMDLIVANDTTRNFLYHNNGDGTFTEIGEDAGVAYDNRGLSTGCMGIDAAHYRNDEAIGIGIGNFTMEMTSFYVSGRDPMLFSDEAIIEGIGSPTRLLLSFGLFFLDYDLDGRLDLFQTNGHLEDEISEIHRSQQYRQPAQLFWNTGSDSGATFELVPSEIAGDLVTPIVGRGAAYADIDADGDLDIIVTQVGDRPLLLRNEQALGHHWIRIVLQGTLPNLDAIGAWVEVDAGGVTQRRKVMPTRSYLSQVELPLTFGLGENDGIEALRVTWPDGSIQDVDVETITIDGETIIRQESAEGPR
ncbi:MAG: RNA-binding protein [Phycisphaerae bacterium]|nr:RNA-binding protein [Phycisphaerae bacterium]